MAANGLQPPLSADELWLIDRLRRVSAATPHCRTWGSQTIANALPWVTRSQSNVGCYLTTEISPARSVIEVLREAGRDIVYRNHERVGDVSQSAIDVLLQHFPNAGEIVDLPNMDASIAMRADPADLQHDNTFAEEPPGADTRPPGADDDDVPLAPHQTERIEDGDELALTSFSWRIRSIDELMAEHQIDQSIWEPDKSNIGYHEGFYKTPIDSDDDYVGPTRYEAKVVGLHRISCSLRRKVTKVIEDAFAMLMERMRAEAPIYPARSYRGLNSEPHLLELALYDHHYGKLAWHVETGQDYDLSIADQLYRRAVDQILARAKPYGIDRILFPIGHDLLNYDNARGETTSGTPQDNDSRPAKVFDAACAAVIYAIERLVEVAPVDVIYVPGNHDTNVGRFVACTVGAWFHRCSEVTVDIGPAPMKCYTYGDVFLGLTHGDGSAKYRASLPMLFTQQFLAEWGRTKHHEIHLGHFHTKNETSFMPLFESGGVLMRVLPSLCGRDYWHTRMGYLGASRATDALLWSSGTGLAGYFTTSVEELLN